MDGAQQIAAKFSKNTVIVTRTLLLSMYVMHAVQGVLFLVTGIIQADLGEILKHLLSDFLKIGLFVPILLIVMFNDKYGKQSCLALIAYEVFSVVLDAVVYGIVSFSGFLIPLAAVGCTCLLLLENKVSSQRQESIASGLPDADDKYNNIDVLILIARCLVASLYLALLLVLLSTTHEQMPYIASVPALVSVLMLFAGYKVKYAGNIAAAFLILTAAAVGVMYVSTIGIWATLRIVTSMLAVAGGLMLLSYMGAGRLALDHLKKMK